MLWQKSIINLSIPWYRLNFPTTTFRVLKIFSRYLLGSISLATNKYYCFHSKAKMFMTWFLQFHLRKLISYSHVTGNSKKKEWMKLIIGIFNQFFWLTWSEKFFLLIKWINTNVLKQSPLLYSQDGVLTPLTISFSCFLNFRFNEKSSEKIWTYNIRNKSCRCF